MNFKDICGIPFTSISNLGQMHICKTTLSAVSGIYIVKLFAQSTALSLPVVIYLEEASRRQGENGWWQFRLAAWMCVALGKVCFE